MISHWTLVFSGKANYIILHTRTGDTKRSALLKMRLSSREGNTIFFQTDNGVSIFRKTRWRERNLSFLYRRRLDTEKVKFSFSSHGHTWEKHLSAISLDKTLPCVAEKKNLISKSAPPATTTGTSWPYQLIELTDEVCVRVRMEELCGS